MLQVGDDYNSLIYPNGLVLHLMSAVVKQIQSIRKQRYINK